MLLLYFVEFVTQIKKSNSPPFFCIRFGPSFSSHHIGFTSKYQLQYYFVFAQYDKRTVSHTHLSSTEYSIITEEDADRVWDSVENAIRIMQEEEEEEEVP